MIESHNIKFLTLLLIEASNGGLTFINAIFCTFTKGIMENLKVVELTGANRWDPPQFLRNETTNKC